MVGGNKWEKLGGRMKFRIEASLRLDDRGAAAKLTAHRATLRQTLHAAVKTAALIRRGCDGEDGGLIEGMALGIVGRNSIGFPPLDRILFPDG